MDVVNEQAIRKRYESIAEKEFQHKIEEEINKLEKQKESELSEFDQNYKGQKKRTDENLNKKWYKPSSIIKSDNPLYLQIKGMTLSIIFCLCSWRERICWSSVFSETKR